MEKEFEMIMIGEMNYFLGLQVRQLDNGTFINQSKYAKDLERNFGLDGSKESPTPMSSTLKFGADKNRHSIDEKKYQGMIGSLLYITAIDPIL